MFSTIKCKKCRHTLLDETECQSLLLNAHNTAVNEDVECSTITDKTLLFLSEDNLPDWVKKSVEEDNWTKGKLMCTHCGARIGAFDFVSGIKCACEGFVLPSVYLIKSKVDVVC
ncbi:hypothetical protein ILUMI_13461 [Ignelater luminosus]|uniref:Uncharacterized protein n=1 Tax=Ignelater luminosus TaxID=2038154 RepID=A0A8K0CXR9_IGNLU|nr:hypothetical protein ILUMI_13461 [Ignelater luminosus]